MVLPVVNLAPQMADLNALVVGAGFGGIYQLYRLRQLGLTVKVIDVAGDVGGTWYWNKYPGAMSDTESFVYRYSWDKEDLQSYPWTRHYVKQPEVLAYLQHVVERHDLRKHMAFNTELLAADWDQDSQLWHVRLSSGSCRVRYLVTALGVLSRINFPDLPGLDTFKGVKVHTARWPDDLDVTGKRVGVIGCGSTGIQVIANVSDRVQSLVCFQRHPQYSVPSRDRPVEPGYRESVNDRYDDVFQQVKSSVSGFGFVESTVPYSSVTSPEEREAVFERLWTLGNGFRFLLGGFSDIAVDREANEAACDFIRRKIAQTVKDPEKARKLQPRDLYARRPLCDSGYYDQFNRPNVDVELLQENPIEAVTETGIAMCDGTLHELDMIIFATGFDAIEGNYNRIRIRGRNGVTLKDHWDPRGPTSYLGVAVPQFPNLMMITGPQGPFANLPPAIEAHVDLNARLIARAEASRRQAAHHSQDIVIEALPEAEKAWGDECERVAQGSLFKETASWIFGQNVPGKKVALRFYFAGLKGFYKAVEHAIAHDFAGFRPMPVPVPVPVSTREPVVDGMVHTVDDKAVATSQVEARVEADC